MGEWGWHLAMKGEVASEETLWSRVEEMTFEGVETTFLDREAMEGMMLFWKGMFEEAETVEVNTELAPVIDRYYREGEWGLD